MGRARESRIIVTAVLAVFLNVTWSVPVVGQAGELDLYNIAVEVDRLTPQALTGDAFFTVDSDATTVLIKLVSNVDDITTEIWYPEAEDPIDPENVDEFGGEYFEIDDIDPLDAALLLPGLSDPGYQYVYAFESQGAGDYTVCFEGPYNLNGEDEAVVITSLETDSGINVSLLITPGRVHEGDDVILTAFVFDDDDAVTGATVTTRVLEPEEEDFGSSFSLLDDGNGVDDTANDGLYSASFSPTAELLGEFQVAAEITGSGGSFYRQAGASFEVFDPPAVFASSPDVSFVPVDADEPEGDTLIDAIGVNIDIDVATAGHYGLAMIVEEVGTEEQLVLRSNPFHHNMGAGQTLSAYLDAAEVLELTLSGFGAQFAFLRAELTYHGGQGDDAAIVCDRYEEGGTTTSSTYAPARFDRPDVTPTGDVDISTTGTPISALNVDVEMYVLLDGTYEYSVNLEDSCGGYITTLTGEQTITGGIDTQNGVVVAKELNLVFPGSAIGANGIDGPYEIRDLVMYGEASLVMDETFETSAYSADDFEDYAAPADCNENDTPDLCDVVNETSLDCNFDLVPDECCFADLDFDGQVNSVDEGLLQSQYSCSPVAGGCTLCDRSDLDGNSAVNPADLGLLQVELGSCESLSPFGGGGPGEDGSDASSLADGGSPLTGMWQVTLMDVEFEIQPAGGGRPVETLEANTQYEVHYAAEHTATNGFALFAVTTGDRAGITAGSAPPDGDWAGAGRLHYMDRRNDQRQRRRAYGYSDDYHRNQQVTNNFHPYGPERQAGSSGHLCSFTTGGAGELDLHLYLWMLDQGEETLVLMESTLSILVEK